MEGDTDEECGCFTYEVGSHWWTHSCPQHQYTYSPDRITPMYTREEIDAALPE